MLKSRSFEPQQYCGRKSLFVTCQFLDTAKTGNFWTILDIETHVEHNEVCGFHSQLTQPCNLVKAVAGNNRVLKKSAAPKRHANCLRSLRPSRYTIITIAMSNERSRGLKQQFIMAKAHMHDLHNATGQLARSQKNWSYGSCNLSQVLAKYCAQFQH